MSFVKNNDGVFGEVLGNHFSNFGIQQVMVTVNDDIGCRELHVSSIIGYKKMEESNTMRRARKYGHSP